MNTFRQSHKSQPLVNCGWKCSRASCVTPREQLVGIVQYTCIGLFAVPCTDRTYGSRNTVPVTVLAQFCCWECHNRVTGCRQPSATVLLRPSYGPYGAQILINCP